MACHKKKRGSACISTVEAPHHSHAQSLPRLLQATQCEAADNASEQRPGAVRLTVSVARTDASIWPASADGPGRVCLQNEASGLTMTPALTVTVPVAASSCIWRNRVVTMATPEEEPVWSEGQNHGGMVCTCSLTTLT